jgi:hemerythrin-like domain-containing protein
MVYPVSRITYKVVPGVVTTVDDPLQHLVACHERIEERLQTIERLMPHLRSTSEDKRQQAREALDNALRFLKTMGELHTRDEEESLFPRLLQRGADNDPLFSELTALLEEQHREKEGVLEKLLAQVAGLPPAPAPLSDEQARRLESLAEHLASLYRPHMMVENQRLIPLAGDTLKPADLDEIRQEMRNRRGA